MHLNSTHSGFTQWRQLHKLNEKQDNVQYFFIFILNNIIRLYELLHMDNFTYYLLILKLLTANRSSVKQMMRLDKEKCENIINQVLLKDMGNKVNKTELTRPTLEGPLG